MAIRGAGGTDGGIGRFFGGLALTAVGIYMFLSRVTVSSNVSSLWSGHAGLLLVPLAAGLALLFFSGKSVLGWLLTLGSVGLVFVSVLANLTLYFQGTNFFRTVAMLTLIAVGLVMTARSLRSLA